MTAIPVVILGAGGHTAELCAYAAALHALGRAKIVGCLDDHAAIDRAGVLNVLGRLSRLPELLEMSPGLGVLTGSADNMLRRLLVARAEAVVRGPVPWWTLLHPTASVGPGVEIGAGTCVAAGSILTTRIQIGRHCIVNVKTSVSHDTVIGDFVNLNPGVTIASGVRIGDGSYIGAGATIIDKATIGEGAVVGAGTLVLGDVPANATVVGVPARVIKYHTTSWEPVAVPRRA